MWHNELSRIHIVSFHSTSKYIRWLFKLKLNDCPILNVEQLLENSFSDNRSKYWKLSVLQCTRNENILVFSKGALWPFRRCLLGLHPSLLLLNLVNLVQVKYNVYNLIVLLASCSVLVSCCQVLLALHQLHLLQLTLHHHYCKDQVEMVLLAWEEDLSANLQGPFRHRFPQHQCKNTVDCSTTDQVWAAAQTRKANGCQHAL